MVTTGISARLGSVDGPMTAPAPRQCSPSVSRRLPHLVGLLVAVLVLLGPATGRAQTVYTDPGYASRPPSAPAALAFGSVQKELRRVVERRDVPGLLALVHPEFRVLGRPVFGLPGFREYWLESPERDVWTCLEDAIAQSPLEIPGGGIYLWSPSAAVYPALPTDFDMAELVSDANLRAAPGRDAPVVATLSAGSLLRYAPQVLSRRADGLVWRQMMAGGLSEGLGSGASGRTGWVAQRLLRSPFTLRFHFAVRDGHWLLDSTSAAP